MDVYGEIFFKPAAGVILPVRRQACYHDDTGTGI